MRFAQSNSAHFTVSHFWKVEWSACLMYDLCLSWSAVIACKQIIRCCLMLFYISLVKKQLWRTVINWNKKYGDKRSINKRLSAMQDKIQKSCKKLRQFYERWYQNIFKIIPTYLYLIKQWKTLHNWEKLCQLVILLKNLMSFWSVYCYNQQILKNPAPNRD